MSVIKPKSRFGLMTFVFIIVPAVILTGACRSADSEGPTATPDRPRYSTEQVLAAISSHTVTCALVSCGAGIRGGDVVHAGCVPKSSLVYVGNGIWHCRFWAFDERTGFVFSRP